LTLGSRTTDPRRVVRSVLMVLLTATLVAHAGCGGEELGCTPDGNAAEDLPKDAAPNGTCAPEGEPFTDHFACAGVAGPCPTTGESGAKRAVAASDEQRADPDLEWSKAQLVSCSCSCCHGEGGLGAHEWTWDFEGSWTDSATTARLRQMAGEPGSEGIDPTSNNGFSREVIDLPTTDSGRMRAFLERTIERR
jgi:hypothetical protein